MILPHSWCACRINRIFFLLVQSKTSLWSTEISHFSLLTKNEFIILFSPHLPWGWITFYFLHNTFSLQSVSLFHSLPLALALSLSLIICTWPGSRIAYFWLSKLGHGYVTPNNPVPFTPKAFGLGKTSRIVYCLGFSFELSPSRWAAS